MDVIGDDENYCRSFYSAGHFIADEKKISSL